MPQADAELAAEAISIRNDVVHEGCDPPERAASVITGLMVLCRGNPSGAAFQVLTVQQRQLTGPALIRPASTPRRPSSLGGPLHLRPAQ